MDKFNVRHTAFAIILFFSITMFFQLGSTEIQPWDEGLYAYRAKVVHEKGLWWDQTEHSIGGLYSSSYPPLTIWAMALNMKFIEPHHAVRLLSAFCGSLALLMIYLIGRRLLNTEMSLLVIIGLAVTLIWNKYSRQGMTDVPIVAFSLVSLLSITKFKELNKNLHLFPFLLLFVLSFAAALMSKVLVSLLPLIFVSVFLFEKIQLKKKLALILATVAAIGIALPWHIYMASQYGYDFYRIFFASHVYSEVEGNTAGLGIFYYFNQLIITNPFFILAIFLVILIIIKRKTISLLFEGRDTYLTKVMIVWLGSLLFLFTVSVTKLPHYLVYMIIPSVLLSAMLFQGYKEILKSGKLKWILLTMILAAFLWSFSFNLRQEIKLLLTFKAFSINASLYLIGIILMLILSFRISDDKLSSYSKSVLPRFAYVVLTILVIRLIVMSFMFNSGNILGGLGAADVIKRSNKSLYGYIYHKHNESDKFNPQLAWYTNGWNTGHLEEKSVVNVALPKSGINFKMLSDTDTLRNVNIIYYLADDLQLAQTVVRELRETRPIIYTSKNYIIFGTYHYTRKEGKKV